MGVATPTENVLKLRSRPKGSNVRARWEAGQARIATKWRLSPRTYCAEKDLPAPHDPKYPEGGVQAGTMRSPPSGTSPPVGGARMRRRTVRSTAALAAAGRPRQPAQ